MKKNLLILFQTLIISFASLSPTLAITAEELRIINLEAPIFYGGTEFRGSCPQVDSLDSFLQALAHKESGGVADHPGPSGSSASGKYQYIDGTWGGVVSFYGPAGQYARAYQAPEEVQDAVAYLDHLRNYNRFDGDLFKMAVQHFYPAANNDSTLLDRVAPGENTETPREYAEDLLSRIEDGRGESIPLTYNSAPDFQLWLDKAGGAPTNLGCPAAGLENFVHYLQTDPQWASHPFGSSTLAEGGCGPTSVAMVLATMYDSSITPVEVADWGSANDGHVDGVGSSWSVMMEDAAVHFSNGELRVEDFGNNLNRALETLDRGGLVLATGRNTGPPYTQGGHIIVIRERLANGNYLIGDPALTGGYAVDHEWTFNDLDRGRNYWGVTK